MCRLIRSVAPLILRSAIVRRLGLRSINVVWRADRVAAARAVEVVEDSVACTVTIDSGVFSNDDVPHCPAGPPAMPDHARMVGEQTHPGRLLRMKRLPASACPRRRLKFCPMSGMFQCSTIPNWSRAPLGGDGCWKIATR